jgi:hypothetical protein
MEPQMKGASTAGRSSICSRSLNAGHRCVEVDTSKLFRKTEGIKRHGPGKGSTIVDNISICPRDAHRSA